MACTTDAGRQQRDVSTPRVSGTDDVPSGGPSTAATVSADAAYEAAFGLPLSLLTTALALSSWVALGSLTLAVADGLGSHPVRRLAVGAVLVGGSVLAVWQREWVCLWLWRRPATVVIIAFVELLIVAADGLVGGPFAAFTLTSVGIAVVVAPPRIVWQCVGVLLVGYLAGVLLGHTPAALVRDGDLAGVVGQAAGYPFAALGLLALAAVFKRFVASASEILEGIRSGVPALTPSLGHAILSPGAARLVLPPGRPPSARLTPTEVKVVKGLAAGKAPKQLAHEWGVSLATIRTHIRHAKAKTRARTIRQLVALAARPEWPEAPE